MANKFEVKNNGAVVAHTESAGDNGTTNIVVSELTPETVYDKFTVSYLGKEESTVVPSFTTKAASNVPVTGVTMSQKTASMNYYSSGRRYGKYHCDYTRRGKN
mgnify:CR=1 FL=1